MSGWHFRSVASSSRRKNSRRLFAPFYFAVTWLLHIKNVTHVCLCIDRAVFKISDGFQQQLVKQGVLEAQRLSSSSILRVLQVSGSGVRFDVRKCGLKRNVLILRNLAHVFPRSCLP